MPWFVREMANTGEKIDLQFVSGTDNISKNITNKVKSKSSTYWWNIVPLWPPVKFKDNQVKQVKFKYDCL